MSIRNYHRFMGYADPTERPEFKLPPKPEPPIAAGEKKSRPPDIPKHGKPKPLTLF